MRPQLFLFLLLAISAPAARVLGERLVFHSDKARPGDPPRGSGVHAGLPGAAPGLHFKEQQKKAIENDEKAEKLQKGGIHSWLPGWLGGHPREFRFWPAHDDTPIYPHVGAKPTSTAGQRQGEASKASGHRDHPDTPVRFSSLFSFQQQPAKPRAWREAIADWYEGIELSARFGWYVVSRSLTSALQVALFALDAAGVMLLWQMSSAAIVGTSLPYTILARSLRLVRKGWTAFTEYHHGPQTLIRTGTTAAATGAATGAPAVVQSREAKLARKVVAALVLAPLVSTGFLFLVLPAALFCVAAKNAIPAGVGLAFATGMHIARRPPFTWLLNSSAITLLLVSYRCVSVFALWVLISHGLRLTKSAWVTVAAGPMPGPLTPDTVPLPPPDTVAAIPGVQGRVDRALYHVGVLAGAAESAIDRSLAAKGGAPRSAGVSMQQPQQPGATTVGALPQQQQQPTNVTSGPGSAGGVPSAPSLQLPQQQQLAQQPAAPGQATGQPTSEDGFQLQHQLVEEGVQTDTPAMVRKMSKGTPGTANSGGSSSGQLVYQVHQSGNSSQPPINVYSQQQLLKHVKPADHDNASVGDDDTASDNVSKHDVDPQGNQPTQMNASTTGLSKHLERTSIHAAATRGRLGGDARRRRSARREYK